MSTGSNPIAATKPKWRNAQGKVKLSNPKGKKETKEKGKKSGVLFDSPAMVTRRKKVDPATPAISPRSKRRLSLRFCGFYLIISMLCSCELVCEEPYALEMVD